MSTRSIHSIRFGWQFAAALLIALLVLSLSIPAVRAALSAWLGLSLAPSDQMPITAVTLAAPLPTQTVPAATAPAVSAPTSTPVPATPVSNQPAEFRQLATQAGWELLAPSDLPSGYRFQSIYLDTNHAMVIVTYRVTRPLPGAKDPNLTTTKTITLLQALKNDFVPMQLAPSARLNDVQVNGQPGVFVKGAWDTEFVKDEKDPKGGKMVSTWRSDLAIQNLYWQVGKVFLVLLSDDDAVTQADLIRMASSMK